MTVDPYVDAKSDLFCLPQHIESYSAEVFGALAKERYLRGLPRDGFLGRLTHYFAEVNALRVVLATVVAR